MPRTVRLEIPPLGPFTGLVLKKSLGPVHFSWYQHEFFLPPVMLCLGSQPIYTVHLSTGQRAVEMGEVILTFLHVFRAH